MALWCCLRLRATLAVCWGILLPLSTPIFCSPSDIMALIWAPVDFDGCFRWGCRPLLWCLAHSDCVHPRPRLCAPSTQIVYLSTNLHANADWVHPRPRLCAPSTQIVYTLDPDCVHPRPRLCTPSTQTVDSPKLTPLIGWFLM